MRELFIAYGNSCFAKIWSNKTISWDNLCKKLSTTIRTTESAEEYPNMKKACRDAAKDKGGFVGGHLKNNRRKIDTVTCRSMLTMDADHAKVGFIDRFLQDFRYASSVYTTHGHTPEAPRYRIIVPLTRDVSPDEYVALTRFFAADWGIDQFDECSYKPNQLMYWPTTPSNGEFISKITEGDWLDPDTALTAHPNWKDCSLLPTSSRESVVRENAKRPQEDPLTKSGVVGAFCRAYPIEDAIETFLSDIYEPSAMNGRYDYIPADSSAGLVLYDGKFAYSHHATDPACGKLLNAFDLVRIHRFRGLDEKTSENTPPGKLPSFKAMTELAVGDERVKEQFAEERKASVKDDFSDEDWQKRLEFEKSGKVKDTLDNIVLIIQKDENLQGIAFNRHRDGIDARNGLPWEQIKDGWNDSDNASLKVYLNKIYGIYSPTKTKDAVLAVATSRAYHPIQEYLDSLPEWDGMSRINALLSDYFGAEQNSYTEAAIRKTLVAAVARIYHPGTKFDSVLILNGPQGIGKSTFFAKLAGAWFSDSLTITDMKDKAGPEKLQGYWVLELGELAGMRKADVETVKSFISRVDDKYRASYGLNVESHPRQCVIVGSTNTESGFLRDITGNRRFWPVRISGTGMKKPWQITPSEVAQIWAEAIAFYKKGEKLYLEGNDAILAVSEQADAMENDDREGIVRAYLDTLLPEQWDSMSLYERRNFLNGSEFGSDAHQGVVQRKLLCNMEIWCECFGKDPSMLKRSDSYEISSILRKIGGWDKYDGTKTGTFQFPIFGNQRALMRKQEKQD